MNQISLEEVFQWQQEGKEFQLIDVRRAEERILHNIGGTHIPLDEIIKRSSEIIEETVVIYCRKGVRSQIAIQRLQEKLPDTAFYNLKGGIGEKGIGKE